MAAADIIAQMDEESRLPRQVIEALKELLRAHDALEARIAVLEQAPHEHRRGKFHR